MSIQLGLVPLLHGTSTVLLQISSPLSKTGGVPTTTPAATPPEGTTGVLGPFVIFYFLCLAGLAGGARYYYLFYLFLGEG